MHQPPDQPPPAISVPFRHEVDIPTMLWAIAEKESGNVDNLEGGRFQFKEAAWNQSSRFPYSFSKNPKYSFPAAREYLEWITRELDRWSFRKDPYFMALAWRAGINNLRHCITTYAEKQYAQQVDNLYVSKRMGNR
jgi:hypothetical protein